MTTQPAQSTVGRMIIACWSGNADEPGPCLIIEAETNVGVVAGAVLGPGRAAGEEQCERAAEPDHAANADVRLRGAADCFGALAGDLRADGNLFAEVVG